MSATKDKLVHNVKAWIKTDKEMKELQSKLKELKKNKNELTNNLVEIMKTNDIDCVDITGGKIMYTQNRIKSAINKKYLMDCLDKYFQNKPNVDIEDIGKFILDNREIKTTETIKHKITK
jgi:hypothetical protein